MLAQDTYVLPTSSRPLNAHLLNRRHPAPALPQLSVPSPCQIFAPVGQSVAAAKPIWNYDAVHNKRIAHRRNAQQHTVSPRYMGLNRARFQAIYFEPELPLLHQNRVFLPVPSNIFFSLAHEHIEIAIFLSSLPQKVAGPNSTEAGAIPSILTSMIAHI